MRVISSLLALHSSMSLIRDILETFQKTLARNKDETFFIDLVLAILEGSTTPVILYTTNCVIFDELWRRFPGDHAVWSCIMIKHDPQNMLIQRGLQRLLIK